MKQMVKKKATLDNLTLELAELPKLNDFKH